MSTWAPHALSCPGCGETVDVPLLKGMHITNLAEVQAQIRDGTFQVNACPGCGETFVVERTSVYTDFDRGHYVAVEPEGCPDWRAARAVHRKVFDESFTMAPDVAQEIGQRLTTRLAIGLRALREKVLAWDAGLDDRALEGVKLALMHRKGRSPQSCVLRLQAVYEDGGHMLFGVYPKAEWPPATDVQVVPTTKAIDHEMADRTIYETILADLPRLRAAAPWIFTDWLVDVSLAAPAS